MGILDILTGGLGGVVGAVGAIGGKIIDLKMKDKENEQRRIDQSHELSLRDKDLVAAESAAKNNLKIEDLKGLASAVESDKATYGGGFVDTIRGMVRPVLTGWAAAMVTYTTYHAFLELQGIPLGPDRSMALIQDAMFLSSLAVSWWFGSRPASQRS